MKYSFVIPCYNSEKTIGGVVDEIREEMHTLNEEDYEILLVNDYSRDHTRDVIFSLAENDPRVKAISMAKNSGQDAACLAGYRYSTGEYVVSLDDDGQHPVNELDRMINKLQEG